MKTREKGITLIALIITIIVLLILAGVALATLTGDSGILSNAEKAKENTKIANILETANLVKQELFLEQAANYRNSNRIKKATLIANLAKEFNDSTVENGIITTSDEKYDIIVKNDLEIVVVKHGEDFLKKGEIDLLYFYDETEQKDELIVSVYARIGGIETSYEKYAQDILKEKNNDDKEKMFVESDKYWNGIYPGTENITNFADYIAKVLENETNIPTTLEQFKSIYAPECDSVDEMLILWQYVEPEGWNGKSYSQYANEILDTITETGDERKKILEQYYIDASNYFEFGENIYNTWDELMAYWEQEGRTTYASLEDLAVNEYGYPDIETFLMYDNNWINPQGYEEYINQFMEEFQQKRILKISCSNNETYDTLVGERIDFIINQNGKYVITATSYDGKTKSASIEIDNIIKDSYEAAVPGKRYEEDKKIMIGNQTISMLAGFTLSGETGEYEDIEKGIVAYLIPKDKKVDWNNESDVLLAQKTYDQFVWIPVRKSNLIAEDMDNDMDVDSDDINKMIKAGRFPMVAENGKNEDGTIKYRSVLYNFYERDGKLEIYGDSYVEGRGSWEPGFLEDGLGDKGNSVGITKETLQKSFDKMVANVKENGGFWIGRYETSNMLNGTAEDETANDKTNKVTIIKGTKDGLEGLELNWYRMYAQQKYYKDLYSKEYDIETKRESNMIWGCQWNQICLWMRNVKNIKDTNSYYIINSIGMGNYGVDENGIEKEIKEVKETGSSTNYKVKNIYDLAGNVAEWTMEANFDYARIYEGGSYENKSSTDLIHGGVSSPIYTQESIRSRITIY